MAIARNLSEYGVYGITRHEFSSTSSSPVWILLVAAGFWILGVHDTIPLFLNLALASLFIFLFWRVIAKHIRNPWIQFLVLMLVLFITPLTTHVLSGMEHILQTLVTTFFVYLSASALSMPDHDFRRQVPAVLLAPLVTATRYEGLFVLLIVCLMFFGRHRLRTGVLLLVVGLIPVFTYGVISRAHGSYFLPNPVFLFGNRPDIHSIWSILRYTLHWAYELCYSPHLLVLMVCSLAVFSLRYQRSGFWDPSHIVLACFFFTVLLQAHFAKTVGFRRNGYLVPMAILGLAIAKDTFGEHLRLVDFRRNHFPRVAANLLLVVVLLVPLGVNGATICCSAPRAMKNIWEQQFQMGLFLRSYFQGDSVAANDVGAINYLADIRNLDLVGLGSIEILDLKRGGRFTKTEIERVMDEKQVRIAIIYDRWFRGIGLQDDWVKVGEWSIRDNVVCGGDTVSFYAVTEEIAAELRRDLRDFSGDLADGVIEGGEYCTEEPPEMATGVPDFPFDGSSGNH